MHEVFRAALRTRVWWSYIIFPSIVIAGVGLSLARAYVTPPKVSGLLLYIVVGEIAVRFVQVLMFVGMGVHAAFFGARWRLYFLGIAAGFGFYSTVALLMTAKLSDIGARFKFLWGRSLIVAYSLAVLIWIWFLRAPQPEEASFVPEPPLDIDLLNQHPDRHRKDAPAIGLPLRYLAVPRAPLRSLSAIWSYPCSSFRAHAKSAPRLDFDSPAIKLPEN